MFPGARASQKLQGKPNLKKEVPLGSREAEGATGRPSVRRPRRNRAQKIEAAFPEDPGPSPRTNSRRQYPAARLGRRTIAGSEGAETGSRSHSSGARAPSLRARARSGKVRAPRTPRAFAGILRALCGGRVVWKAKSTDSPLYF